MAGIYTSNKNRGLIEDLHQISDLSSGTQSISNALYGLSGTDGVHGMPSPRHRQGYVFYTRPLMNMTDINLRRSHELQNMLGNIPESIQGWVKSTLDYRLGTSGVKSSRLVNNNLAFIPLLTNTIKTLSGFPDKVFPTYTSAPGLKGETYSQIDGTHNLNKAVTFDPVFDNIDGEPHLILMDTWTSYISLMYEGKVYPHIDLMLENERDYCTRQWRILFKDDGYTVSRISATYPGYPVVSGIGEGFSFDRAKSMQGSETVSFRFMFDGIEYNQRILIDDFNSTVELFDSRMIPVSYAETDISATDEMVRVPHNLAHLFRYRGVPRINPDTLKFETWVDKEYATSRVLALKNINFKI